MSGGIIKQLVCGFGSVVDKLQEVIDAIQGGGSDDFEFSDSGWICDEGGTDNWIRIVTPYVNGIAGIDQTIDSGISCADPAPVAQIDAEVAFICNTATGFYDQMVTIVTDGVAAAPIQTATTVVCSSDSFQGMVLPDTCATIDGANPQFVNPIVRMNQSTGLFVATDYMNSFGDLITGVVAETDPCDCDCLDCNVSACTLMEGFDAFSVNTLAVGQTMPYEILVDGVSVLNVLVDYQATAVAGSKASWYTSLISDINTAVLPDGWSIVLEQDILDTSGGDKVVWRVVHDGSTPSTLVIDKEAGGTVYTMASDGAGTITGTTNWDPDSPPYAACP